MSLANLISEQSKLYLDINVNNINAQSQTVEGDVFFNGELTVADLNVTNFTVGAIESNNIVPSIGIESGISSINFARMHSKKVNNIVFCNLYARVDIAVGGLSAAINIERANLPIGKASDFTVSDDVIGTGTFENSNHYNAAAGSINGYQSVYCNVGSGSPNRLVFTFFKEQSISHVNQEIQINFSYTTD